MKKKRFLRLVMSYGFQRKEATRIAARVGEFGSYEALFEHYRPALIWRTKTLAFRRIEKATVAAARGIRDVFAAAFGGVDFASGADSGGDPPKWWLRSPSPQAMTKEQHEAAAEAADTQ